VIEELTSEAILNDFVLIGDESRTSTAVVDPTTNTITEINEWGPQVKPAELTMLVEKLHYLSRGADMVVFAGSLPRGVDEAFYAEAIRDLNRRGVHTALDSDGEPLRLGLEAEPFLVSPNQPEAEALAGQEFHEEQDFLIALDELADLGARNVLITHKEGCFALIRESRGPAKRYRAVAPHVDVVSGVGAGDVLLAGFIVSRLEGGTAEEALRKAVAAGTAATLEVGAGLFEPREVGRLIPAVRVSDLHPAAAE
jgi:1-phosphofructokinase family hexose kinase